MIRAEVVNRLQKNQEKITSRLASYLDDPRNEDTLHGTRTSMRKFDAVIELMPKKFRKANSKQLKAYRRFFRASSKIRDYDVIKNRISQNSSDKSILREINLRRNSELDSAIKRAQEFELVPPIKTKINFSDTKLEHRIAKVTQRLIHKISKSLPRVIADESSVKELHKLRKDCKKLRYVLEALPPNYSEQSSKEFVKTMKRNGISLGDTKDPIEMLETLQDLLGSIRDSDITIDYLNRIQSKEAQRLLIPEREARRKFYLEFIQYFKGSPLMK